jgi:uncharacterized tellurite resistance protein B-like protein
MIESLLSNSEVTGCSNQNELKLFIAKALAGSIISDGRFTASERQYVKDLIRLYKDEPSIIVEIDHIIRTKTKPELEPIGISESFAEKLLNVIIDICTSDYELHAVEAQYIQYIAKLMNVKDEILKRVIHQGIWEVRADFFNSICHELNEEERYWLAVVTLKLIYADEQVDSREIAYLQDIYQLLGGNKEQVQSVKNNAKEITFDSLPKVYFDDDLSRRIMRYLLEISLGDHNFDYRELQSIQRTASLLGYSKDALHLLIRSIKTSYLSHEDDIIIK